MHLLPFDYGTLRVAPDRGLARLRGKITQMREDNGVSLLFDCGDFLQGTPLADAAIDGHAPHPMIAAFNDLDYDAVVLGNHDFDYGIPALRRALADLECPVLAANIMLTGGPPLAVASCCILREVEGHSLSIGVVGLTCPPPALVRDVRQPEYVQHRDAVAVARQEVVALQAQNADVVIAICHFGIDTTDATENVADQIAQIDGIDAVLAGHMHDVFPTGGSATTDGVDANAGKIHGTPVVMAGAFGQAIGQIDLMLRHDAKGWHVKSSHCAVHVPDAMPAPVELAGPGLLKLQDATLARLNAPLAQSFTPLTNAFSMIAPDRSQDLLAQSRIAAVRGMLKGTRHAGLPVLGVAAPHRAGNKDAPTSFLNVAPGIVTMHDATCIFPFQDPVIGVQMTGADLRNWLELIAARFWQIVPGLARQALIDPSFAPYDNKTLFGLRYRFDISRPAGDRVVELLFQDVPVAADQTFAVATTPTSNPILGQAGFLCQSEAPSQDILCQHLRDLKTVAYADVTVWDFAPLPDTSAQFVTAANADRALVDRIVQAGPLIGTQLQEYTLTFG